MHKPKIVVVFKSKVQQETTRETACGRHSDHIFLEEGNTEQHILSYIPIKNVKATNNSIHVLPPKKEQEEQCTHIISTYLNYQQKIQVHTYLKNWCRNYCYPWDSCAM